MPEIRFRALRTFESPEAKSTYVEGMTYTVREGNTLLGDLLAGWIVAGLAEIYHPADLHVGVAGTRGQGKVF